MIVLRNRHVEISVGLAAERNCEIAVSADGQFRQLVPEEQNLVGGGQTVRDASWKRQAEVLHQCICSGGYLQKVLKGECTIIFIQKNEIK